MKCGELHMLTLKWQATTMIYLVLALVTREANRWVIITNLERENQKRGARHTTCSHSLPIYIPWYA